MYSKHSKAFSVDSKAEAAEPVRQREDDPADPARLTARKMMRLAEYQGLRCQLPTGALSFENYKDSSEITMRTQVSRDSFIPNPLIAALATNDRSKQGSQYKTPNNTFKHPC